MISARENKAGQDKEEVYRDVPCRDDFACEGEVDVPAAEVEEDDPPHGEGTKPRERQDLGAPLIPLRHEDSIRTGGVPDSASSRSGRDHESDISNVVHRATVESWNCALSLSRRSTG